MSAIKDYLNEVARHLNIGGTERRRILDELQSHLTDQVEELAREEPATDRRELQRRVLRDFGDPRELALSYEPNQTVIRRSGGEVALRITQDVARGTGKVLKFTAIAALALIAIAMTAAVVLLLAYGDDIQEQAQVHGQERAYYDSRTCSDPCQGSSSGGTFFVHEDVREVEFSYDLREHPDNTLLSSVKMTVTDPSGDVRFEQTFTNQDVSWTSMTWGPETGDWRIDYEFTAWEGTIRVDVLTTGLPR
ncbi:MAG: HAAS signaling domain-containing protein [Thermoplasmatota archaeon]